ncbi:MAG: hypothetical protein J5906_09845 [Acidaminococcaceae bacterium]|nr:hypothetical protein [Acidaminococcaceae bacterium]
MKKWKKTALGFLAVSVFTAGLAFPFSADAKAINQTMTPKSTDTVYKDGSVFSSARSEKMRLAAKEQALAKYYITSGKKLDKAVALLEGLPSEKTGLDSSAPYFYRMDKSLTGNYFHHVKVFNPDMETQVGEYYLAKDDSCVFRRLSDNGDFELLEGSTEKLLKKVEVFPTNYIIPLHGAGKVLVRVPGNLPYDLTITSLNENIAKVNNENGQLTVTGNARGYADVLVEVEIGGYVKSAKIRYAVMDERDIAVYEARRAYVPPPIVIGMSWGWGHHHHGGPHHHHRGHGPHGHHRR